MEDFIDYLNVRQEEINKVLSEYWEKVEEIEDSHGKNTYGLMTPTVSSASKDYEAIEMLKSLVNNGNSLEKIENIIGNSQGKKEAKSTLIHAIQLIDDYKKAKRVEKHR